MSPRPRLKRIYEKDEISRRWFDYSGVRLDCLDDLSPYFDDEALIELSAPLSESTVTASIVRDASGAFDAIRLAIQHPAAFSMVRHIRFDADFNARLELSKFRIKADYANRQLCSRSLTLQARAAQGLGFKSINLDAVGDYTLARLKFPDDRWAGYWVWPRLGFDAEIPAHVIPKLPAELQACRFVGELIATEQGLNEWELHGDTLNNAQFDLTAGSKSWQRLAQYLQQRNIKV